MQPSVAMSSVAGPPLLDDPFQILSTVPSGINVQFLSGSNIPQVQLPSGWNALLQNPMPVVSVNSISQVQLSANWNCYGTASCLISSHLINHAPPILSNELSNTSVWLCYETAPYLISLILSTMPLSSY